MRIIKISNPYFPGKHFYRCTIDGHSFTSHDLMSVESWKDKKVKDEAYNAEIKELTRVATTHYYNKGWSLD